MTDPRPKWRQVADDLRARIGSGELATGDRLPTEPELAEQYDVGRGTLRAALDLIEREGLLVRRPKVGTVVRGRDASPLAEFLLARIAEDEADAKSAHPSPWVYSARHPGRFASIEAPASMHGGFRVVILSDNPDRDMSVPHILRWEPARVLAECEAKRRIVELAQQAGESAEAVKRLGDEYPFADGVVRTLQYLALPYADHPDYQADWRP